ncbi:energy transducer TonB [Ramlibacter alkalitolerans]|uniref:Energy transducer TonB n=1 Tax=Ramlibacter alkalitolerans TaxID=2039631 RepID=A0ABS1JUS8_9BURK|nr:energy transducer TonB [Ramlibacter alkalitolerans]MBL0428059.1 energy transducer TonB [Ramlibacter alkalitolerans]
MPASRNALIAGSVVLLHVGALWALQSGLLRRVVETVVPVEILTASLPTPPAPPRVEPPAPPPPEPKPQPIVPQPRPVLRRSPPPPAPAPAPQPVAVPEAPPTPAAVTGTTEPQPAPPPVAAPVAAAPVAAPAPAPAPAKVELPISDADYLQNPAPEWPRMSQRLGERGLVVLRVLIGADGRPRSAQVKQSSGFTRLDEASVTAAMAWRYVPGKRGGVPEEMWVNVPIRWGD